MAHDHTGHLQRCGGRWSRLDPAQSSSDGARRGMYSDTVVLTSSGAKNSPERIRVSLHVVCPTTAVLPDTSVAGHLPPATAARRSARAASPICIDSPARQATRSTCSSRPAPKPISTHTSICWTRAGLCRLERRLYGPGPELVPHAVPAATVSGRPVPDRSDDVRQCAVRVYGDADAPGGAHGGYRARPTDDRWRGNIGSRLGQQHDGRACRHWS